MSGTRDWDHDIITVPSGTGIEGPITIIGGWPPEATPPNVRIDEDKHGVDDVAVSPVESFRLERMSRGYFWIGVYMAGGSRHTFQVTSKSRITVTHREEPPL